jgi:hypothetical protein
MVSIAVYAPSFVQVEKIEKEVGRLDAASVEPPKPDWSSFADKQNESRQYVYNGCQSKCLLIARALLARLPMCPTRLAMCPPGLLYARPALVCARGLLCARPALVCARAASFISLAPQCMYK